ncbi:MAG TPA: CoA transferase [Dehalococcoidia bacterium]|nr:CoA transferase [Dehalococcoidia bacterium]
MGIGPLDGVRVIELANYVAAPAGGALMADMGADVVKIEPPAGDGWRGRPAYAGKPEDLANAGATLSPQFNHDNRGKRSVTLDIANPAGGETVRLLIDRADIFLTNLLPKRRVRLGFDPATLLARNPRLIYVGVTGYGPDGPDADRPGFDYSAFWASSGIMSRLVPPEQNPPLSRPALGDHTTGLTNVTAALAALRLRDRTGEGQVCELSLFSVSHWVNGADLVTAAATGNEPPLHDREQPLNPLWNTYRCADDGWLLLTMIQPDAYWRRFCRALGCEQWLDRAEWSSTVGRAADSRALTAAIAAELARHSRADWQRRLDAEGIIYAPVSTVGEAVAREQTAAQQTIQTVETGAGPLPVVRAPFQIAGAEIAPRGPAPELGQHSEAVLLEAGLSWEQIADLRERGAFG